MLEFCKEHLCPEFAQSSDPTEPDTRKYYCPAHEAKARGRGETGERMKVAVDHYGDGAPAAGEGELPPVAPRERLKHPWREAKPVYEFDRTNAKTRQWLTVELAAKELGVGTPTLRRIITKGQTLQGRHLSYDPGFIVPPPKVKPAPLTRSIQEDPPCPTSSTPRPQPDQANPLEVSLSSDPSPPTPPPAAPTTSSSAATGAGSGTSLATGSGQESSAALPSGPRPVITTSSSSAPPASPPTPAPSPGLASPGLSNPIEPAPPSALRRRDASPEQRKENRMPRESRSVYCIEADRVFANAEEAAGWVGCKKSSMGACLSPQGSGKAKGKSFRWATEADIAHAGGSPSSSPTPPPPPPQPVAPERALLAAARDPGSAPPVGQLLGQFLANALAGGPIQNLDISLTQGGTRLRVVALSIEVGGA